VAQKRFYGTIGRIQEILADGTAGRPEKAKQVAEVIRLAGGYRWVGLYDADDAEIAALGWTGMNEPAHPRFPVSQGLSGAAVGSGSTTNSVSRPGRRSPRIDHDLSPQGQEAFICSMLL
jgi:putative methionine-R-sulfoxide reductase with GAF domain